MVIAAALTVIAAAWAATVSLLVVVFLMVTVGLALVLNGDGLACLTQIGQLTFLQAVNAIHSM